MTVGNYPKHKGLSYIILATKQTRAMLPSAILSIEAGTCIYR